MLKVKTQQVKNWIYVTGVPRSGSTFVGKILSIPIAVDYIHEPFNPQCGMIGVDRWYSYVRPTVDTEAMKSLDSLTQEIFDYSLRFKRYVPRTDSWHQKTIKQIVGSRGEFYLRLAKPNPFHRAAVIKDPIGNLLTEYLYQNFQVKPVVVIKHPLSFIASLKRVNWMIQASWMFDEQPELIEDYFKYELNFVNRQYDTLIEGSAAYWRATYKVILEQASRYSDWQIVILEELSQNPIETFHHLYQNLDLPWSEKVNRKISHLTGGNVSARARKGKVQDFKRNSADIFQQSLKSVNLKERQQVFEIVQDVALKIYPKSSFALETEQPSSCQPIFY